MALVDRCMSLVDRCMSFFHLKMQGGCENTLAVVHDCKDFEKPYSLHLHRLLLEHMQGVV